MLKFLSLIFVAIVFFVSDAWSIVAQSARNAMSYRNVVKTTAATKPQPAAAPEAAEPEVRSINLKDAVSKNINAVPFEDFEVLLTEEKGYRWDASYSNNVIILNKSLSANERLMTFKQIANGDAEIFFDYINPKGETVLNKVIYIKAQ